MVFVCEWMAGHIRDNAVFTALLLAQWAVFMECNIQIYAPVHFQIENLCPIFLLKLSFILINRNAV
jgi:hypothetical protein